jgi:hypothetical protein
MMLRPQVRIGEVIQMMSKDKLHWFWATGVLPGFMFGDLDDRNAKWSERPRRPINRLLLYLKRQGKHRPRTRGLHGAKNVR